MRTFLALLLVSVLGSSCSDGSPTRPEDVTISFETIAKLPTSGFSQPQRKVIRDPGEWLAAWQTAHAGQNPVPALPPLDFGRETVLLAAAGARGNGCYSIDVTRVSLTGRASLEAEVTETVPGPACVCILIVTQPVHLVRVATPVMEATFVERQLQQRC